MQLKSLLKFREKKEKLPQYTSKADLPKAEKLLKEKTLKEVLGDKKYLSKAKFDKWDKQDTKVCRDLERAYHRKDKRELGGWLKAWAKEDKKELRRFEKEMARD